MCNKNSYQKYFLEKLLQVYWGDEILCLKATYDTILRIGLKYLWILLCGKNIWNEREIVCKITYTWFVIGGI